MVFLSGNSIFNLSVDVVSRHATRRLVINGSEKQLYWNWDDNMIKIYNPELKKWNEINYETSSAESGYNKKFEDQANNEKTLKQTIETLKNYANTLETERK